MSREKNLQVLKLFAHKRIWVILFFGFASGLPLALTAGTLQAWLTVSGISIISIGFFGLVGQPYVFKFIWAPLLDHYIPPFLGRRRGWLIVMQLALIISIAAMALIKPAFNPVLMAIFALLTAFLSASQDIAINAYTTEVLSEEERGLGAAMSVLGFRIGYLVSGAFALILADVVGWRDTYFLMSLLMLVGVVTTFIADEPVIREKVPVTLKAAIIEPFAEFLSRDAAWLFLLLIVLYKIGDAFTLSLSSTFLLRGMHFSLIEVGTVNKFVALFATIVGSLMGGIILAKIKLYRSLFWFGILQAATNLGYMFLALVGKNYVVMVLAIALENLTGGMATAAFLALIMTLCDKRYTGTQFALLTALATIGRVFVGPISGVMVTYLGWAQFYWWCFIFALPGVALLVYLKRYIVK
jgi:MFS transporter, PAT family, beta-lactamase induction signal transducer AmpG